MPKIKNTYHSNLVQLLHFVLRRVVFMIENYCINAYTSIPHIYVCLCAYCTSTATPTHIYTDIYKHSPQRSLRKK